MVDVPAVVVVTTPPVTPIADDVLLHVPPLVVSLSMVLPPAHTAAVPVIGATVGAVCISTT